MLKLKPYINKYNWKEIEDALEDALNYQTIEKYPQRILKLKPYINKYNWKEIEFPAGSKEWVKFEKNNKTIALSYYIYRAVQKQ